MSIVCRICLQEDKPEKMASPCLCTGSHKYVHPSCLGSWLNIAIESIFKIPSNPGKLFNCQVCKAQLDLSYMKSNKRTIEFSDNFWNFLKIHTSYIYFILFQVVISLYYGEILLMFVTIFLTVYGLATFIKSHGLQFMLKGNLLDVVRYGPPIEDLKTGTVIRATSQVSSGIFRDAVAVIIQLSSRNTLALALNKSINYPGLIPKHFGGPDLLENIYVLHDNPNAPGATQITDEVFLGGRIESSDRKLVLQGCAEWIPGQLEGEIAFGNWEIDLETKNIFNIIT